MRTRTPNVTSVQHRVEKAGECPRCGKRVVRSRTFKGTTSPSRTFLEVHADLSVQGVRWAPDFMHARCVEARP